MRPLNKGKKPKLNPRELIKAKKAAGEEAVTSKASAAASKQPSHAATRAPQPPAAAAPPLLDAALLAKAKGSRPSLSAGVDDSNRLILAARRKEKPRAPQPVLPKAPSKREQRKLQKLAERKAAQSANAAAYSQIAATALTQQQQRLLHSSGEMGKTATHRERILRRYREAKLGIRTADSGEGAHRQRRSNGTEAMEGEERGAGEELQQDEVKESFVRSRKRKVSEVDASALPSSVVSSYGLDPARWRSTANAIGHIGFDTSRHISYGSSDEEDSEEGEEQDEEGGEEEEEEDGDVDDEKEEEDEDVEEVQVQGDDEEVEAEAAEAGSRSTEEAASSGSRRSGGVFSVPFDVIATSNRPKKQRRVVFSRAQPPPTIEAPTAGSEVDEMKDESEHVHTTTPAPHHPIEQKATSQLPPPADLPLTSTQPEEMKETDDSPHPLPTAQPLISLRGKTKLVPAPPPSFPHLPPTPPTSSTAGKFTRTPKPTITPLPLPPNTLPYTPSSLPSRVSNNDALLHLPPTPTDSLDHSTKGQAIPEDASSPPDPTPHLWTRTLPDGRVLVYTNRPPHLQHQRLSLPIASFEQELIELLASHHILLIEGGTGTGKTTQVPQFLLENGYGFGQRAGMIGVTQPRRVAAVTTCQRVAEEMNLPLLSSPSSSSSSPSPPPPFDPAPTLRYLARLHQHRLAHNLPSLPGSLTPLPAHGAVSYAVRYDSYTPPSTLIKFMTDGLLLRHLTSDFLLSPFSVVIIDEAHERGRNTDVLIGLVSRSVTMRERLWREGKAASPLKLIIMSATLRLSDFTANPALFPSPPPVLSIPVRQHAVVEHWSRVTAVDGWMEAMVVKLMRMHVKLPEGGILVFLNGREEIEWMQAKVEEVWREREKRKRRVQLLQDEGEEKATRRKEEGTEAEAAAKAGTEQEEEEAMYILDDEDDGEGEDGEEKGQEEALRKTGEEEKDSAAVKAAAAEQMEADLTDLLSSSLSSSSSSSSSSRPLLTPFCLPLYSLLPTHLQLRVFAPPPSPSHRVIVFSTNVAETSLTIPHIRYVLDSGREKRRTWDRTTGCIRYEVGWISRASAEQRKGRAGRTGPGHVYRMYSAAVYEQRMEEQVEPEVLREPLEGVVLMMKGMGIDKVEDFPFPTPPSREATRRAEEALRRVGAVDRQGKVTELGRGLARWPVAPRYARMIALGHQGGCLKPIIAIVAALSVEQLFLRVKLKDGVDGDGDGGEEEEEEEDEEGGGREERLQLKERQRAKKKALLERLTKARTRWHHPDSDLLTALRVIGGYEYATRDEPRKAQSKEERERSRKSRGEAFCRENFVRVKAMEEVALLRRQLTRIALSLTAGRKEGGEEEVRGEEEEEAERVEVSQRSGLRDTVGDLSSPMLPPTPAQERLLRQMLLSGMVDHVARKMSEDDKRAALASGVLAEGTNLAGAYSVLLSPHPAFIHPTSVLFPASAQPLYLVYHSLQLSASSTKQFLRDCTLIDEQSLCMVADSAGLVDWGGWMEQPRPQFNKQHDRVEGWKKPSFGVGDRRWELQPTRRGWMEDRDRGGGGGGREREAREFVRLLLQGDVFEDLRAFVPFLAVNPSHLAQPGSLLKGRQMELLNECARYGLCSRRALRERWKVDPVYLLREYSGWVQPSKQAQLKQAWPPNT